MELDWGASVAAGESGRSEQPPAASTSANAKSVRTGESYRARRPRTRGAATRRRLEAGSERPGPEALPAWLVERNRVVPADDRVVEEVQPQPGAVAGERRAGVEAGLVRVRGHLRLHLLAAAPRDAGVVEHEAVEGRKPDRQDPELEATDEREAQLGVRQCDAAAEQAHGAARPRIRVQGAAGV